MALRIGGKKSIAPPLAEPMPMEEAIAAEEPMPEEMPEELPSELPEEPVEEEMNIEEGTGTVDPMQVMYKDGAQRAAEACGNCKYYGPEGACSIVSGPIDPEGICNIYSAAEQEEEMPVEEPMPEGEPYPEEEPVINEAMAPEGY